MNVRPRQPQPPSPPTAPTAKSAWTIVLALMVGLATFAGLVFLSGPVGMIVLVVGGVLLAILLAAAAHYLFWGYWLGDAIRREVEEEERDRIQQQEANAQAGNDARRRQDF